MTSKTSSREVQQERIQRLLRHVKEEKERLKLLKEKQQRVKTHAEGLRQISANHETAECQTMQEDVQGDQPLKFVRVKKYKKNSAFWLASKESHGAERIEVKGMFQSLPEKRRTFAKMLDIYKGYNKERLLRLRRESQQPIVVKIDLDLATTTNNSTVRFQYETAFKDSELLDPTKIKRLQILNDTPSNRLRLGITKPPSPPLLQSPPSLPSLPTLPTLQTIAPPVEKEQTKQIHIASDALDRFQSNLLGDDAGSPILPLLLVQVAEPENSQKPTIVQPQEASVVPANIKSSSDSPTQQAQPSAPPAESNQQINKQVSPLNPSDQISVIPPPQIPSPIQPPNFNPFINVNNQARVSLQSIIAGCTVENDLRQPTSTNLFNRQASVPQQLPPLPQQEVSFHPLKSSTLQQSSANPFISNYPTAAAPTNTLFSGNSTMTYGSGNAYPTSYNSNSAFPTPAPLSPFLQNQNFGGQPFGNLSNPFGSNTNQSMNTFSGFQPNSYSGSNVFGAQQYQPLPHQPIPSTFVFTTTPAQATSLFGKQQQPQAQRGLFEDTTAANNQRNTRTRKTQNNPQRAT